MSYTEEQFAGPEVLGTAEDLSASAAAYGEKLFPEEVTVKRIMFVVTTAVAADTTAPVVEFNKRPTPGSATGEEAIGTLTIPDGTAAGEVLYKDVTPVRIKVGESLSYEHITQAADSSSAAGAGYYLAKCALCPADPRDNSELTESA